MTERGRAIARGLGAIGKSALLIAGVPASIVQLWWLAPRIRTPVSLATITTTGGWVHLVLIGVGCLWAWASIALVRQIVAAIRRLALPVGVGIVNDCPM